MDKNLQRKFPIIAQRAVELYAKGIISAEELTKQLIQEWEAAQLGDTLPSDSRLMRMAQRICSCELFYAWHSQDAMLRNSAFDVLRRYLHTSLRQTRFATVIQDFAYASEDIVHQTLEALQRELLRGEQAGPDDPTAFLKWTQTILIRNARAFIQHNRSDAFLSLEAHAELFSEQFVDKVNNDPLHVILLEEFQQTLKRAIAAMRNPRYRQILIYTYLVGVDDEELANHYGVKAADIYKWRHRALKKLRTNEDAIQALYAATD